MKINKTLKILSITFFILFFAVSLAQAEWLRWHNKAAFDFKLQDLNQNTYTLGSYRDKQPVILFFWTVRCDYCRAEFKMLKELYPKLVKEGWELLSINILDSKRRVDKIAKAYNLPFKVLLDKDAIVAYIYGVMGVPTYYIVDKKGNVVFYDNYFPANYNDLNQNK